MNRARFALPVAAIGLVVALGGCASKEPPPPVKTGFLSTYSNLEQQAPNSWVYRNENNRLARYDKFIVNPVEVRIPEGSPSDNTTVGDVNAVKNYMREAMIKALTEGGNEVVDAPAADVAELRLALTDAYDEGSRVGIALEGEMIDSVSSVQLGAIVESQRGRIEILRFWKIRNATNIMDDWAKRVQVFVDGDEAG